jgi:hypothetical protein
MSRLSAHVFGRLPVAGLVGVVAVAAGCGGSKTASGPLFLEMVEYDHYFFDDLASKTESEEARSDAIKAEIERLATQSWRLARANIIAAGKDSIPRLIANIDRADPTHVPLRPVPGPTMPEARETWTLGQVCYAVLTDLVGDYGSSFKNAKLLPPRKAVWEEWWRRNQKKVVLYTEMGTIPAHVRKQKEAVVAENDKRYPDIDVIVAKTLEKRTARAKAREEALKAREQKRLEEKKRIQAKQAARSRASAKKARIAKEAASEESAETFEESEGSGE